MIALAFVGRLGLAACAVAAPLGALLLARREPPPAVTIAAPTRDDPAPPPAAPEPWLRTVVARDPFRMERRPSRALFGSVAASDPAPPPSPPPPPLPRLAGIVSGRLPAAVLVFPRPDGPAVTRLLEAGERWGSISLIAVGGDSVVLSRADTAVVLRLPERQP